MHRLFGFLCGTVLGTLLLLGCDDPCQAPLSSYCSGSDCPNWDEAVADAMEFAAGNCNGDWSASSGKCGEYVYVLKVIGIGSSITQYFDASGVLVAVREQSDTPNSCNDSSFEFWYGPTLDCELERVDDFCDPVDGSEGRLKPCPGDSMCDVGAFEVQP